MRHLQCQMSTTYRKRIYTMCTNVKQSIKQIYLEEIAMEIVKNKLYKRLLIDQSKLETPKTWYITKNGKH